MARTSDDFLQDIARSPDDDALKRVFADWLLERGEPRGEFMALQLKEQRTDEELSREALLLKAHVKQWLPDEILINVVPSSIVFEKGVFAGARVSVRSHSALTASLTHPAWATVRRLAAAPHELAERCPVLEQLTELDELQLTGLAVKERRIGRLKVLGVIGTSPQVLQRAFASRSFEGVRELQLGFHLTSRDSADETRQTLREYEPERLRWLFLSRLGAGLQRLVMPTGWLDLSRWFIELEMANAEIPELQITPMVFEPSSWWIRFSEHRQRVTIFPGSDLNASFSEGPVREILTTAPEGWFLKLDLPEHLGWESVRRLPCLRRAPGGTWR